MSTITTKDGTLLYYKDWGGGPPILFSHGWPLTADAWEDQMVFFAARGFRCIAHDRRGHGRSSQPAGGHDMNTYADDLASLMSALDLKDVMLVGHSTGGGELVRYLGRHGTGRVGKLVLIAGIPPGLLRTAANPDGLPIEVFDGLRKAMLADRAQFFRDFSVPFYGVGRPGVEVSQGLRDAFWLQVMMGGHNAIIECTHALSETDFGDDLAKIDVPTLLLHGDDDQVVPLASSSRRTVQRIAGARLEVYAGLPHGLCSTHKDRINADLLAFAKAPARKKAA